MSRALKNTFVLGAVAAAALVAAPANAAVTITGTGAGTTLTTSGASGGSAALDFNGFGGSPVTVIAGLTAKLTLSFASIVGNTFNFGYTLENTSSTPITASRISSFGFNVDPNISSASSTGTFDFATVDNSGINIPNVGNVEVCFKDVNTGTCTGNGGGLDFGQSATGTLALAFSSPQTAISLSNFYVRYLSLEGAGVIQSASGQVTSPVPEPAAWMLMILGFAGIGFAMRRQRYTHTARVRFV